MSSKTEEYLALAQRTANSLTRYWESWTDYGVSLPSVCCFKIFFDFFSKTSWQGFISMVNFFVKVHRQTRRKSATQSYRDPPGQPVASKKLLFSAVRKYRSMKSDDAFSHGFAMP
jgi:hypothetical protein